VHKIPKQKASNTIEINDETCRDHEIEQIISESIVQPEERKPICNLIKTESELQRQTINSNSPAKFMLLYIILNIPIIVIILTCTPSSSTKVNSANKLSSDSLNHEKVSKAFSFLTGIGDYNQPNSNSISNVSLLQ